MTVTLVLDPDAGTALARFEIHGDFSHRQVSVVGSWNAWTPGVDMLTAGDDGSNFGTVQVPWGQDLHFRYLATGDDWFDDLDADEIGPYGSTVFWPQDAPGTGAPSTQGSESTDPPAPAKKAAGKKSVAKKPADKATAAKTTATKSTPAKATPTRTGTKKAAPAKAAPAKAMPAKAMPSKAAPAKAAAAKTTAAKSVAAKKAPGRRPAPTRRPTES